MDGATLPQFSLIAESVELTEELKRAINIVKYKVKEYNAIENPTEADKEILREYVDDFNYQQRRNAVRGSYSSPLELLEMYAQKRIAAKIKLGCHSSNNRLGIEFETHEMQFSDFYEAHKAVFPSFWKLKAELSSLAYLIRQNMLYEVRGKIKFKRLAEKITSSEHPYHHSYFLLKSDNREDYTSYGKVRNALSEIVEEFFPGAPIPEFEYQSLNWFMERIAESASVGRITRWFIWRVVYAMHPELDAEEEPGSKSPSRHVAWCAYDHKRRCTKLDIECHSSVSCPFYIEAASKRK